MARDPVEGKQVSETDLLIPDLVEPHWSRRGQHERDSGFSNPEQRLRGQWEVRRAKNLRAPL